MRGLIPVVLLWASSALAHDADLISVMVKQGAQPGVLLESVTLTASSLGFLAPLDADGDQQLSQADLDARQKAVRAGFWDEVPLGAPGQACELLEARAWLREGFIELQGQFRCPEGELRQDFRILRVLPANYRVVLGNQLASEGQGRAFAQGSLTTIAIPRPPPPGSWDRTGFTLAFDAGVGRGLSLEVLCALLSLAIAFGTWRRRLAANGLLLLAVTASSWASLEWWPPTILLLLVTAGAAAFRSPPLVLALVLGLAIGSREGGGPWWSCLGVGAGTVLVLALASAVMLPVGVMLQRRPRMLKLARWAPLVVAIAAVAVHARVSW